MRDKSNFLKILMMFLVVSGFFVGIGIAEENVSGNESEITDNKVVVHFFWSESCPHCAEEKPFLESIADENEKVELEMYKISEKKNQAVYQKFNEFFGTSYTGVPFTVIGEKEPIVGFDTEETTGKIIEERIDRCLEQGCNDFSELVSESSEYSNKTDESSDNNESTDSGEKSETNSSENKESTDSGEKGGTNSSEKSGNKSSVDIPLFGEVSAEDTSLVVLTAMVAFVDGFNPCSLWVITFLLGLVVISGSRKKTFAVGFTFLLVTTIFYGAFIFGLLNAFSYVGHLFWIRAVVALVAVFFGIVNIKDFFFYKKGISFTIPDKFKPKIFKGSRRVMSHSDSLPSLIGGTAIMAAGITLVELPCTAGFPMVWTNIVSSYSPNVAVFGGLLVMYMIIYLLDELAVFLTVVFTMEKTRFQEEHGRLLKLIGGMIMVALAGTLLLAPDMMETLKGSVTIFGGSVAVSLLVYWYYKDKVGVEEEGPEDGESSEGDD